MNRAAWAIRSVREAAHGTSGWTAAGQASKLLKISVTKTFCEETFHALLRSLFFPGAASPVLAPVPDGFLPCQIHFPFPKFDNRFLCFQQEANSLMWLDSWVSFGNAGGDHGDASTLFQACSSWFSSWQPRVNFFPALGRNTKTPGGQKTPSYLRVQHLGCLTMTSLRPRVPPATVLCLTWAQEDLSVLLTFFFWLGQTKGKALQSSPTSQPSAWGFHVLYASSKSSCWGILGQIPPAHGQKPGCWVSGCSSVSQVLIAEIHKFHRALGIYCVNPLYH